MSTKTYGAGSGPFDGLQSTAVNWDGDAIPADGDAEVLDGTRVADLACDVVAPATGKLASFTQAAAYTGKFTLNTNKILSATLLDISGKVDIGSVAALLCTGSVAADMKVYLRAGSVLTGYGSAGYTGSILHMFGNSRMMECAGTIQGDTAGHGVTLIFYIQSETYPVQAQNYSQFIKTYFLHNVLNGTRDIYFQAGTHTFGDVEIQTYIAGGTAVFRLLTGATSIVFLGDITISKAAGTSIQFIPGWTNLTFKKSVDFSAISHNSNGDFIMDGTAAQTLDLGANISGAWFRFRNTVGGVSIPSGKKAFTYGASDIDGKLEVAGELDSWSGLSLLSGCVLSGSGVIDIYAGQIASLLGSSTFSGWLYARGYSSEDVPFSWTAGDYGAKFPNVRFQNEMVDEFERTVVFDTGDFTFKKVELTNDAICDRDSTYDWRTNNPNVTIMDDFTVDKQGTGLIKLQFGTGALTPKKAVNLTGVEADVSDGETVLGGQTGSHQINFGSFGVNNLTINCNFATKIFQSTGNVNRLRMTSGTVKFLAGATRNVVDFDGTGGTMQSASDGSQTTLALTNKGACSDVSFKDVWMSAANMINAKDGCANLGNTRGIVFQDSFGEF